MNYPYDDDDDSEFEAMRDAWLTEGIPYNDRSRQEVQDELDQRTYGGD